MKGIKENITTKEKEPVYLSEEGFKAIFGGDDDIENTINEIYSRYFRMKQEYRELLKVKQEMEKDGIAMKIGDTHFQIVYSGNVRAQMEENLRECKKSLMRARSYLDIAEKVNIVHRKHENERKGADDRSIGIAV